jgi:hypothetical protein
MEVQQKVQRLIESGVERRTGDVESAVVRKLDEELSKCKAVIDTLSRCSPTIYGVWSGFWVSCMTPVDERYHLGTFSPPCSPPALAPNRRHSGSLLAHEWMPDARNSCCCCCPSPKLCSSTTLLLLSFPEAVLIHHTAKEKPRLPGDFVLQAQL